MFQIIYQITTRTEDILLVGSLKVRLKQASNTQRSKLVGLIALGSKYLSAMVPSTGGQNCYCKTH